MTVAKQDLKYGVLLALEAAGYGNGGAVSAATDGFHVVDDPVVDAQYLLTGERNGRPAGTATGDHRRVQRFGRWLERELQHELRLPGVAYTASVVPSIYRILRMMGHSAVLTATGGAEKYTFTPTTSALESGTGEIYTAGEKWPFKGAYCRRWEIGVGDGDTVPLCKFAMQGILDLPTDVTVPAITYPLESADDLKALGMVFTITTGGQTYQFILRECVFSAERQIQPRLNRALANGVHAGFALGRWSSAEAQLVFEATALTGSPYVSSTAVDPYRLYDEATVLSAAIQIGSAQYKRVKINGSTVQFGEVKTGKVGSIKTIEATLLFHPSTSVADDPYSLVTD